jgi:hypothetical protein
MCEVVSCVMCIYCLQSATEHYVVLWLIKHWLHSLSLRILMWLLHRPMDYHMLTT